MSAVPDAVTYADGVTAVLPGDRVSVRLFLRRRSGEVIYVPGISKRRGTYEHHGLKWVGVSLPDGWAVGTIVLPETGTMKKSVRFLGRGVESPEGADAKRRVAQEEAEEDAAGEDNREMPGAGPAVKPKPAEWFAGAVAAGLQLGMYLAVIGAILGALWLLGTLW